MPRIMPFLLGYVGLVGVKNSIAILKRADGSAWLTAYGAAGLLIALGNLYLAVGLYRRVFIPALAAAILACGLAYLCVILVVHLRAGNTVFALVHFLGGTALNVYLLRAINNPQTTPR